MLAPRSATADARRKRSTRGQLVLERDLRDGVSAAGGKIGVCVEWPVHPGHPADGGTLQRPRTRGRRPRNARRARRLTGHEEPPRLSSLPDAGFRPRDNGRPRSRSVAEMARILRIVRQAVPAAARTSAAAAGQAAVTARSVWRHWPDEMALTPYHVAWPGTGRQGEPWAYLRSSGAARTGVRVCPHGGIRWRGARRHPGRRLPDPERGRADASGALPRRSARFHRKGSRRRSRRPTAGSSVAPPTFGPPRLRALPASLHAPWRGMLTTHPLRQGTGSMAPTSACIPDFRAAVSPRCSTTSRQNSCAASAWLVHVEGAMPKGYERHRDAMAIDDYVARVVRGEIADPVLCPDCSAGGTRSTVIRDYLADPSCAKPRRAHRWRNPDRG